MAEAKTKPTKVSAKSFVASIPNETRRNDAAKLLKLFESVTGWKPQMWGPTIIGFGRYKYTYESGHSGESLVCGFSPRAANLVIYSGCTDETKRDDLLAKLGKHKVSTGGCVYINKLADIDEKVLARLIKTGVAGMQKTYPVSPS